MQSTVGMVTEGHCISLDF